MRGMDNFKITDIVKLAISSPGRVSKAIAHWESFADHFRRFRKIAKSDN
jgi:hypothetical protein